MRGEVGGMDAADMSSVLSLVMPMATACSFPSAWMATGVSAGRATSSRPPGEVRPGHMMSAPFSTKRMACRGVGGRERV